MMNHLLHFKNIAEQQYWYYYSESVYTYFMYVPGFGPSVHVILYVKNVNLLYLCYILLNKILLTILMLPFLFCFVVVVLFFLLFFCGLTFNILGRLKTK